MHIAFWVGLRTLLVPTLLLGVMLFVRGEAGATMVAEAMPQIDFPALMSGVGGLGGAPGCNTYGFGCGGSITTGAKFVRP